MSHCLVTGGAGAIGSNLAMALLEAGHQVTVVDDLSSGHRTFVPASARFVEGSVADDEVLGRAFASAPEYVFHLAALFANQNSVDHPQRDLEVNGQGLLKVLEHAQAAKVRKVLYTSSSCVYGNKAVMRESDTDFQPDTPYAITKLLGERYCQFWAHHHKLDTVIVRLFNTYGPHEFPGRYRNVIPNFFQLAMAGKPLTVTGTGEETRDFNFVADTVAGIMGAMWADTKPGDVFNLASGNETRIIDLVNAINAITGNPGGVTFSPRRSWDMVSTRRGDPAKALAAFGHRPRVSLQEGLERTYHWLRAQAAHD